MSKSVNLIFPHQLFADSLLLANDHECYLVESYLFFRHYKFHKQKIAFHRASMKYYAGYLEGLGKTVHYVESSDPRSDVRELGRSFVAAGITDLYLVDPTDNWLEKRLRRSTEGIRIVQYENQLFLNSLKELETFFKPGKKSFFQTSFYKQQRQQRGILLDEDGDPAGGSWTYDVDNRKKYPKKKVPPTIQFPARHELWEEAVAYTNTHFSEHWGEVTEDRLYPITHQEADEWLEQFLTTRFHDFGAYEDAIVKTESILNHSVLSPLINVGLIEPDKVVERSLAFAERAEVPINSTEGFIRQITGWREFIRGMYVHRGSYSRTRNYWNFHRKIPYSFFDGTTGVEPVDETIKKVLKTGYGHHIERLMILGNFMLLCEFDPDEVYRWFMEMFVDAYDWVMVPNVYGMCMFADGGTFATKPYIGGSNYLRKMSDYPRGDWEATWDGLYWRFIHEHREFFSANPRSSMMVRIFDRMSEDKQVEHLKNAQKFIDKVLVGTED